MKKNQALLVVVGMLLSSGCASQRISPEDPVNRALKICGLGIDAKSADAYRAAFDATSKKGSLSFENEASQAIDTQIGILLKQAELKSDATFRLAVEEMKTTRECVLKQVEATRPATKAELLEQCRSDVQRRLSPPGLVGFGVIRYWNQASGKFADNDIVTMTGIFDVGGRDSFQVKVQCDIRNGTFHEAVIENQ